VRSVAEAVDPSFEILTETNVPNTENLSYFGKGDEAHMVYQFSLPPLLLYSLFSGNSEYLTRWAQALPEIPTGCTFFNFTASHDGIGVRPLEGLLPRNELQKLIEGMKSFGSLVNTRQNNDGSTSVYELNITYFDALKGTAHGIDGFQEARFICSQTIMMALKGIPAFYIHSLLATHNYAEGVEKTGSTRSINRRKWNLDELSRLLNAGTHHFRVLNELKRRIRIRQNEYDFHPDADQKVFDAGSRFFIVSRDNGKLVSVSNISLVPERINLADIFPSGIDLIDILSGNSYHSIQTIEVFPYQTLWLKK
jgi:sucrose phosphorylase